MDDVLGKQYATAVCANEQPVQKAHKRYMQATSSRPAATKKTDAHWLVLMVRTNVPSAPRGSLQTSLTMPCIIRSKPCVFHPFPFGSVFAFRWDKFILSTNSIPKAGFPGCSCFMKTTKNATRASSLILWAFSSACRCMRFFRSSTETSRSPRDILSSRLLLRW